MILCAYITDWFARIQDSADDPSSSGIKNLFDEFNKESEVPIEEMPDYEQYVSGMNYLTSIHILQFCFRMLIEYFSASLRR